jgi:2-methylcitrate dehydratase PrpD
MMAKFLNVGRAAMNGLLVVVLAYGGFMGFTDVFEGRIKLLNLLKTKKSQRQEGRKPITQ